MAWLEGESDAVVQMLAVTCELTGTEMSDGAKSLLLRQLGTYPAAQVLRALERCACECRFKLTLADVVSRFEDGRPGAEEAWASFPKNEDDAGVVSKEMSMAWGVASSLFAAGDQIAARVAFKEVYEREVRSARAAGTAPTWRVSPGFSKSATEGAVLDGLRRKLVAPEHTKHFVSPVRHVELLHAAGLGPPALPAGEPLSSVKALVETLT